MVNAEVMASTGDEVAENVCVDPSDVLALTSRYQPEEDGPGIWESEAMLSNIAAADVWPTLNWQCQRTIPQLYPSQ
jgi:hypothetical protein